MPSGKSSIRTRESILLRCSGTTSYWMKISMYGLSRWTLTPASRSQVSSWRSSSLGWSKICFVSQLIEYSPESIKKAEEGRITGNLPIHLLAFHHHWNLRWRREHRWIKSLRRAGTHRALPDSQSNRKKTNKKREMQPRRMLPRSPKIQCHAFIPCQATQTMKTCGRRFGP